MFSILCNSRDNWEIGKHAKKITKINYFIHKYNGTEQIFHQKKMIGKNLRKIM